MNKKILIFIKVLVTVGLIAWILDRVEISNTMLFLRNSSPEYFLAALLILVMQSLLAVQRWRRVLLQLKVELSFVHALRYLWIGLFFNQTLPSSIGGDALRGYYLCKDGVTLGTSMLGVLLDRFFGMVGLIMLVIITLPLLFHWVDNPVAEWGMIIVVLGGVAAIIAMLVLDLLPDRLSHWRIIRGLFALAREGRRQLFSLSPGLILMFSSIIIHLLSVLVVIVLSMGLGVEIAWWGILLVIPLTTLLTTIPISIAGWGVREGIVVMGLGYVGVEAEVALALSILYGLSMLLMALPGGAVWLTLRHSNPEIPG
ncbi:MAG: flippase-like domain-containing protein [Gammaproteobacteria bacterium]|nr:flippase-like domain-containing protein [Gammaproteobacteria bacterium]